jgi:hypothetical protein
VIRKIIIAGTLLSVPVIVYLAIQYGQPPSVSFSEAIEKTQHTSESDPASKVLMDVVVVDAADLSAISATDVAGRPFSIQYTGSAPSRPLQSGNRARFVGHVHGGDSPIFHATQVLFP